MQILVTGLHRSGTSATSVLLAAMTNLSLLDDPQWAIFHPQMARAYRYVKEYRFELDQFSIVKCPRLGECLDFVTRDFPGTEIVYMVRDPRDIYCSINEAQKSSDNTVTTMADNRRFGKHEFLWQGVSLAFNAYARQGLKVFKNNPDRITFVSYEDIFKNPQETILGLCQHLKLEVKQADITNLSAQQLGPIRNKVKSDLSIKGANRWKIELSPKISNKIYGLSMKEYSDLKGLCLDFKST